MKQLASRFHSWYTIVKELLWERKGKFIHFSAENLVRHVGRGCSSTKKEISSRPLQFLSYILRGCGELGIGFAIAEFYIIPKIYELSVVETAPESITAGSSRRRLLPPTSHTTVHTVRYTAVQLTWHFIKYSSADNRPNFESRAFDIAKQMDSFRQTLAYPCVHAALAALPLLIPSFIRFLSRFLGVFQCFHIHIRNLYRVIVSSLRVTLRISPILK